MTPVFQIIKSQKQKFNRCKWAFVLWPLQQVIKSSKFGSSDFHSNKVLPRITVLGIMQKKKKSLTEKSNLDNFCIFEYLTFLNMLNKLISYKTKYN